jgi:drug/metabolite transporter (DMT)-like permease
MPPHILLAMVSVLLVNLYGLTVKRLADKLALFFWTNLFTYLGFIAIYFVRASTGSTRGQAFEALHDLVFRYTLAQSPLYLLYAAGFVGTMFVFQKLLDGYDLSVVMPLSQLSIVFVTLGYVVLGVRPHWQEVLGLLILSPGVVIVSLPADALSSPGALVARLRGVPWPLWRLVTVLASLTTLTALVSYLGTKMTTETTAVASALEGALHVQVFFLDPFHFALGAQFFSMLLFLGVLLARAPDRARLLPGIRHGGKVYVVVALMSLLANLAFQEAFALAPDPTVLLVIDKMSIPLVLFLSVLILEERLTTTKVAGSGLIVGGGILVALY